MCRVRKNTCLCLLKIKFKHHICFFKYKFVFQKSNVSFWMLQIYILKFKCVLLHKHTCDVEKTNLILALFNYFGIMCARRRKTFICVFFLSQIQTSYLFFETQIYFSKIKYFFSKSHVCFETHVCVFAWHTNRHDFMKKLWRTHVGRKGK